MYTEEKKNLVKNIPKGFPGGSDSKKISKTHELFEFSYGV